MATLEDEHVNKHVTVSQFWINQLKMEIIYYCKMDPGLSERWVNHQIKRFGPKLLAVVQDLLL